MGLFTGFSVISGIELLYWIIFKVTFFFARLSSISLCWCFSTRISHKISVVQMFLCNIFFVQVFFHKKDTDPSDGGAGDKKDLGWRERRSQNEDTEDSEVAAQTKRKKKTKIKTRT